MLLSVESYIKTPIRLDRYLKLLYPNLTNGMICKSLRSKDILVNNKKVQNNARVKASDEIYFSEYLCNLLELNTKINSSKSNIVKSYDYAVKIVAEKIESDYLIYDCEDFIIINKPHDLAVQDGTKISNSIDRGLKYLNYFHNKDASNEYKLVHRLDKKTSGLMIIAKGYESAIKLTKAFNDRKISKKYIAIIGYNKSKKINSGIIDNYLNADISHQNKYLIDSKICINSNEYKDLLKSCDINDNSLLNKTNYKRAITKYKKIDSNDVNCLVEFQPITGRMHQIRIHSSCVLEMPILGDKRYGGQKAERMFLESVAIEIDSEIFGREHNFVLEKTIML